MSNNNWRNWEHEKKYGELFYKRSIGQMPEMESSKSVSKLIKSYYKEGDRLLDVACGAGHYLRSLRNIVDSRIDYTGVDATPYYLELAKKAYGEGPTFITGDVLDIPIPASTYDIVICNNLVMHLPPDLLKAFSELIRVSKGVVSVRAMFGDRNYVVKEIMSERDFDLEIEKGDDFLDSNLENYPFRYFNMFTETYYRELIKRINPNLKVTIIKDNDWQPFNNINDLGSATGTRAVGGMQVSGNLILDWRYIIIEK